MENGGGKSYGANDFAVGKREDESGELYQRTFAQLSAGTAFVKSLPVRGFRFGYSRCGTGIYDTLSGGSNRQAEGKAADSPGQR